MKGVDKKMALAAETATDWETVKRVAEQERRREEVRLREDMYASQIIPKREQALRVREDLMQRYARDREAKMDEEEMRKSQQATDYKTKIMAALDQQHKDKIKNDREEEAKRNALEKDQIQKLIEKDEQLLDSEKKKVEERRRLGQQWMKAAEAQYLKNLEEAQNGANRGQKMSPEELKYNKKILKEVRDIKRQGEFKDIFEKTASKKITNL